MGRSVAHAGSGFVVDHHLGRTLRDRVRRADADAHVANDGSGRSADQNIWRARAGNRASDVRFRAGVDHWADVVVAKTGCGGHINDPLVDADHRATHDGFAV